MKKLFGLFLVLFASIFLMAAKITDNNLILGDKNPSTNKIITMGDGKLKWDGSTTKFKFSNDAGGSYKDFGSGGSGGSVGIALDNSDFEAGNLTGWTNVGGTASVQGTYVGTGLYALSFDAAADGNYVETSAYTIPSGLLGRNGVVCIRYNGSDSNLELNLIDGSANELSSTPLNSSTGWTDLCVNFIFPASGTIKARIEAEGDAAIGYFDDLILGDANRTNISQISQTEVYGTKTWATTTSCSWSKTSNDWNAFSADADCDDNARVFTGRAIADASNDGQYPRIRFASLPSGIYKISLYGRPLNTYSSTGGYCGFGFTDGTTIKSEFSLYSTSTSDPQDATTYSEFYTYTTARGDTTFSAIADRFSGGGTCSLGASPSTFSALNLVVERFPLTSEIAYRPELTNQIAGVFWENVASCIFAATGGIMTDADCNLATRTIGSVTSGNDYLQMTVNNLKSGKYLLVAQGSFVTAYASSATDCDFKIYDGTNYVGHAYSYASATSGDAGVPVTSGIFEYASFQPSVTFSVVSTRIGGGGSCNCYASSVNLGCGLMLIPLDQAVPLPNIMNNKATPLAGGKNDLTATLNCDSSSIITSQDGTTTIGVASIGNVASGACAVTFAGIFSATPRCQANALGTTKDVRCQLNPTSSTASTLYITKPSDGTDLTAADCDVFCSGNK
jgi:hypothetical protein